jgi:predicted esterase
LYQSFIGIGKSGKEEPMDFSPRPVAILLLLAAVAGAAETDLKATSSYERFRRVRITVTAPAALAGQEIEARDGDAPLGSAKFAANRDAARAELLLPMPPIGKSYGPLTLTAKNHPPLTINLPDAEKARREALNQLDFVYRPSVFGSTRLPPGDFEQPNLAEDLIGRYDVRITYYNASHDPVTTATKPGRYGAVAEIKTADGRTFHRFNTLYRQSKPGKFDWEEFDSDYWTKLPDELGIDPATAKSQSRWMAQQLGQLLGDSFSRTRAAAVLFAGLSEMNGQPAAPQRLSPMMRDQQWWYAMKRKLNLPTTYPRLVLKPNGYAAQPNKKWPLLIFLHGSGERGDDLSKLDVHGPQKHLRQQPDSPFLILIPQCPDRERWQPVMLDGLLDEILKTQSVDEDRIYLTGLSLGGYGAWDWSIYSPQRFAALAPICGRGDPIDAARIADLPTWVFHGDADDAVPVRASYDMINALAKLNGRVKWTIYPNVGHDSWTQSYNNPELYAWLLQQRRGAPTQPPTNKGI